MSLRERAFRANKEKIELQEPLDSEYYKTFSGNVYFATASFEDYPEARLREKEEFLDAYNRGEERIPKYFFRAHSFTKLTERIRAAEKLINLIEQKEKNPLIASAYQEACNEIKDYAELVLASKRGNMPRFQELNDKLHGRPKSNIVVYALSKLERKIAQAPLDESSALYKTREELLTLVKPLLEAFGTQNTLEEPSIPDLIQASSSIRNILHFVTDITKPEPGLTLYKSELENYISRLITQVTQPYTQEDFEVHTTTRQHFSFSIDEQEGKKIFTYSLPESLTIEEFERIQSDVIIPTIRKHFSLAQEDIDHVTQEWSHQPHNFSGKDFAFMFRKIINRQITDSKSKLAHTLREWRITYRRSDRYTLAVDHEEKLVIVRPSRIFRANEFWRRLAHEYTHILQGAFGKSSNFELLEKGLAGSKSANEGLAVFIENIVAYYNDLEVDKDKLFFEYPRTDRYLGIAYALGMDRGGVIRNFYETFSFLEKYYLFIRLHKVSHNTPQTEEALLKLEKSAHEEAYQATLRIYDGTDCETAVNTNDLHYTEGVINAWDIIRTNPKEAERYLTAGRHDPKNPKHVELLDFLEKQKE